MCLHPDNCLKRLLNDENIAVAVSRLHAENSPVISKTELYCFSRSNNIYSYSIALPIKLDFHLLPQINYIIRQLFEFGLIERWNKLSQSIASSVSISKLLKSEGEDGGHLVVLTVAHITGAILILGAGLIMSFAVFILERIVYRIIRHGRRNKFWNFVNSILDPQKVSKKTVRKDQILNVRPKRFPKINKKL